MLGTEKYPLHIQKVNDRNHGDQVGGRVRKREKKIQKWVCVMCVIIKISREWYYSSTSMVGKLINGSKVF